VSGRNEVFERTTCNSRIVSSRTITIQLTELSGDEVWWLSVTVYKGNWEEGVALRAVLHCPHHNQCASCRPALLVGLVRLPVCPSPRTPCAVTDIDSSGPTVFLYSVPIHLLTDSVIGQPKDWQLSDRGLEVVLMGTIYLYCK